MSVRSIDVQKVKSLLDAGDTLTLLDVRRPADLANAQWQLAGAVWQDPSQTAVWAAGLPRHRSVVIYCVRGGSVSNQVVDSLRAQGLDAMYIEGGIEAWQAAGLPVVARTE